MRVNIIDSQALWTRAFLVGILVLGSLNINSYPAKAAVADPLELLSISFARLDYAPWPSGSENYQGKQTNVYGRALLRSAEGQEVSRKIAGKVRLQFRTLDSSWADLREQDWSGFCCISAYDFQNIRFGASGFYRVFDEAAGVYSKAVWVSVVPRTSKVRIISNLAGEPAVKNTVHRFKTSLQVKFANGGWVSSDQPQKFRIQFKKASTASWVTYRTNRSGNGDLNTTVRVRSTGSWRAVSGQYTSSGDYVRVIPRKPASVRVLNGWPSSLYLGGFSLRAYVAANDGTRWGGKVKLILQYRDSKFKKWTNLDYGYSSRSSLPRLIAQYTKRGYYRVYAPSLGKSTSTSYA